ncbi:hypothetical protein C1N73_32565 (plasmid) [Priestia aryabhattai]
MEIKNFKALISSIDLAFILTALTVLGYALWYCYSLGQNDYYGLPSSFIELDTKGLAAIGLNFPFALVLLFIFIPYLKKVKKEEEEKREKEERNGKKKKFRNFLRTAFFIVIMILFYGFFTFLEWLSNGFIGAIAQLIAPTVVFIFLILMPIYRNFRLYVIGITIIFITSLGWAYFMGVLNAQTSTFHYLVNTEKNKNYVMVKTFKEQFIIAPVDLKEKIITPNYQVIDIKSSKGDEVKFTRLNTGELKVKELTKNDLE